MKQFFLLFTLVFTFSASFAQRTGDVTIYSNTGKKFYVVLNGVRQNMQAETNVKVSDLGDSWYSCRVIAEDKSFNIEKNIGVKKDSVVTYRITEKKGKFKLRYYSEASLGTAPVITDQTTVVYHSTEQPSGSVMTTNPNGGAVQATNGGNISTTGGSTTISSTSTTTTSTNTDPNGENINIDINMNGTGINTNVSTNGTETGNVSINMSGVENGGNVNTSSSTYEETVTTSTTTTVNGTTTHSEQTTTTNSATENGVTLYNETTTTSSGGTTTNISTTGSPGTTSTGNIYTGDDMTMTLEGGCGTTESDMQQITAQMNQADFADDKMKVAQSAAQQKCFSVEQIKRIASLFDFDDDKMTFVKSAYLNCMNQTDYYQLKEIFTFDSDKEEFQNFVNSK